MVISSFDDLIDIKKLEKADELKCIELNWDENKYIDEELLLKKVLNNAHSVGYKLSFIIIALVKSKDEVR